jgi:hypothetical protein
VCILSRSKKDLVVAIPTPEQLAAMADLLAKAREHVESAESLAKTACDTELETILGETVIEVMLAETEVEHRQKGIEPGDPLEDGDGGF